MCESTHTEMYVLYFSSFYLYPKWLHFLDTLSGSVVCIHEPKIMFVIIIHFVRTKDPLTPLQTRRRDNWLQLANTYCMYRMPLIYIMHIAYCTAYTVQKDTFSYCLSFLPSSKKYARLLDQLFGGQKPSYALVFS